jgi:hypothetical protein
MVEEEEKEEEEAAVIAIAKAVYVKRTQRRSSFAAKHYTTPTLPSSCRNSLILQNWAFSYES